MMTRKSRKRYKRTLPHADVKVNFKGDLPEEDETEPLIVKCSHCKMHLLRITNLRIQYRAPFADYFEKREEDMIWHEQLIERYESARSLFEYPMAAYWQTICYDCSNRLENGIERRDKMILAAQKILEVAGE